jgi:hypothetical protein
MRKLDCLPGVVLVFGMSTCIPTCIPSAIGPVLPFANKISGITTPKDSTIFVPVESQLIAVGF